MSVVAACARPDLAVHELVNARGDRIRLLNFGARIAAIDLELRGGPRRVTLAYPNKDDVLADRYFLGATIGRYCNRIRNARLPVGDRSWRLLANNGPHQLHGGPEGFHRRFWALGGDANSGHAEYRLCSPHGDQGFPGELEASVRFSWNDARELEIRYSASTDRPTHVNLSNHTYFNLDAAPDVLDHHVSIDADAITEVDAELLPTGDYLPVAGTALDLRKGLSLRRLVESADSRVTNARGADFNYVLNGNDRAAVVRSKGGKLSLSVSTTCPGLHLYGGQNLGAPFLPCQGLCLETQYFPDSPNHPDFPSTLLAPGQIYSESTLYRFVES